MKSFAALIVLVSLVCSREALAETDCNDPIATWQSRETLRQQVQQHGWTVQRIKVDDGCYEVRAVDRNGNKVKAKYSPATLKIRSFEVEFQPDANTSEYLSPLSGKPNSGNKQNQ